MIVIEDLDDVEKKFIAFSVFRSAMRLGPESFNTVEGIIKKLDLQEEFGYYAKDWIEFNNRKKKQ